MQTLTAIVKPTHECNLACRYCYVDRHAEAGVMDHRTLEAAIGKVVAYNSSRGKPSHFIWHGGEPLLMGVRFYEEVLRLQRDRETSLPISNSIQTNGSLMTEALLRLCQNGGGIRIGVSLDGPADLQDSYRPRRDGGPSFEMVMRGLSLMRQHTGRAVGVILVLHRSNVQRLIELYEFFRSQHLDFKVNPLILSGRAEAHQELTLSPGEFGAAMIGLFDRWFHDHESTITIDPFDKIIGNLVTGQPVGCNFAKSCRGAFVSIGPRGDVYPCGRFDGLSDFWMGNINDLSIDELLSSEIHKCLEGRSPEAMDDCGRCRYAAICGGGCMHSAFVGRGSVFERDWYCEGYKALFEHIDDAVERELPRERKAK